MLGIKISIIIPIYNEAAVLDDLLIQLDRVMCEDIEILFVDDCSTDGTYESISEWCGNNSRRSVLRTDKNNGAGAARNIGIDNASGEYIYFFDADDEPTQIDVLRRLYVVALESGLPIAGGSMRILDDGEQVRGLPDKYTFIRSGRVNFQDYQFDYGFTRFIYNRIFLLRNDIRFLELYRYEDPQFMLRCMDTAGAFYAVSEVTYTIRLNDKLRNDHISDLERGIRLELEYASSCGYEEICRDNIRRVFADFGHLWHKDGLCDRALINDIRARGELQHLLFPDREMGIPTEMYYHERNTGYARTDYYKDSGLHLSEGALIDFCSYFNAFSCGAWKRYTDIRAISLILDIVGKAEVVLYHNRLINGKVDRHRLITHFVDAATRRYVHFDFGALPPTGNLAFSVRALDGETVIYEGFYLNDYYDSTRQTKLAVAFTTYHREEYLYRNIARLNELLDESVHIFVIDNGGTVCLAPSLQYDVFTNKNTGGAGGFARAMLEIQRVTGNYGFTHFVLMDDDVDVDPRLLKRLMALLPHLKGEYKNAVVGGAMFRRDMPYMQVEAGAVRHGLTVQGYGYGMDMRSVRQCLINEQAKHIEYNAWWFCCMPIGYLRADNYPLPIFFQWDDVDYGVRNNNGVITLNGICTWHESFDTKGTPMQQYYATRNSLIVDSCHSAKPRYRDFYFNIRRRIFVSVLMNRYGEALAVLRGLKDYLKGPEWLLYVDEEANNKELLELNPVMTEMLGIDYGWYQVCRRIKDCDMMHRFVRLFSLNGLLLPANRETILPIGANRPVQAYRATSVVYYDEGSGRGYRCGRSRRMVVQCFGQYMSVMLRFKIGYRRVGKAYRKNYARLTSRETWQRILGVTPE